MEYLISRRTLMIRSVLAKPFAAYIEKQNRKWMEKPAETQEKIFRTLLSKAAGTAFGKDHGFKDIKTYEDFKKAVPIRDYEGLRSYADRVVAGESDILWPGKPTYFAKTSGTTSGAKYIPITKDSIPNHINSARNALLAYVNEKGNARFLDRKMIFLSGSPTLEMKNGVHLGRLSGIVNHHVPGYLRTNQKPSYETNCIEDWETKVEAVIDETVNADMSLISGIPPWVQMYFDRLTERTGKKVGDIFPNFQLFVYGGVNFEPYRQKIYDSVGRKVDSVETFPASEGFFAYQNQQEDPALLMLLNSGIFFEFIPAEEFFDENPTRLSIGEVELHRNYALIINSNAGLWGYSIGDTVKFVNNKPYKMLFTGRIKHFISAFGEHVIGQEVERTMRHGLEKHSEVRIAEFSVAPQVNPSEGLPYHEWLVAFRNPPKDTDAFAETLDRKLRTLNSYYEDLRGGQMLRTLKISALREDAFQLYMKSKGKLGGQNKVPRLTNDRSIADVILEWKV